VVNGGKSFSKNGHYLLSSFCGEYMAVLSLNIFSAFFTPTFTTTIPLITSSEERSAAMSLSNATYQLLGVIGPGIAGGLAAWIGTKEIFFVDALTFLIAAIMIATLNDFMDSCWNRTDLGKFTYTNFNCRLHF
jgi:MFS family permease